MRECTSQEIKDIELRILIELHEFCQKNGLRYWLAYGTLLGALRHDGFIPWDDDIDICMPRSDYEKLIKSYNQQMKNSEYAILTYKNNKKCYLPFAKMIFKGSKIKETLVRSIPGCGIYVDIFPLDGVGDDITKCQKRVRWGGYLYNLNYRFCYEKPHIKHVRNIGKRILMDIGFQRLLLRIISIFVRKYDFDNAMYVGCLVASNKGRKILERNIFNQTATHKFENHEFCIPEGADRFLARMYGDWRKYPPVEERVTHHSFIAYIT